MEEGKGGWRMGGGRQGGWGKGGGVGWVEQEGGDEVAGVPA